MVTTPTLGQSNWGTPLNGALNDLQSQILLDPVNAGWTPADQGYVTWSMDPVVALNATALAAGVMTLVRVAVRAQTTVTINSIQVGVNTAGSGLTAGQNFAALYDNTGARVGLTADQSAVWNSTGHKSMNLTVPYAAAAGYYWVGLLSNGTTPPQLLRSTVATPGSVNSATTAATTRFGTFGAAQTATPASFPPASIVSALTGWFVGLR